MCNLLALALCPSNAKQDPYPLLEHCWAHANMPRLRVKLYTSGHLPKKTADYIFRPVGYIGEEQTSKRVMFSQQHSLVQGCAIILAGGTVLES